MIAAAAGSAYRLAGDVAAAVAGRATRRGALPLRWRGVADRLGEVPSDARRLLQRGPVLWVHAASVGELRGARPLVGALRARRPDVIVLGTTLTRTGLALARELPEIDVASLLPLDAVAPMRRLLDGVRLEGFCFTETEIWPTLLDELARRDVPAWMVSGRVSARTAARATWLRPLFGPVLRGVTCCMQTPEDAARIVALGADPARVHVAGSLKGDAVAGEPPASVRVLGARLAGRPLLVAGSTHAGEDEVLLEAHRRLCEREPRLVLLLAPRHPERLADVARTVAARGGAAVSYAALTANAAALPERAAVVLLDLMGPLAHCYALGVAAFVGGTLVPVGGHNVLEPARAACAVLVGPHTATVEDLVARILAEGGGARVRDADDLVRVVAGFFDDPPAARAMGDRARAAIATGEGALARHLAVLDARFGAAAATQRVAG